jgi:PAS domain S-box-containing protein
MSARIRTVATALLVCVACWLGVAIGNLLPFPHTGTAILYPPFAIVTTALLLSPPRRWWIYLLAGSVGSFVSQRLRGDPFSFVLMTEVANYARALLAAWGVRRFGDSGGRLDTLKGMTAFLLFAVVLAPCASAFIGAGVVALHGGGYLVALRPWLLSNVLTGLTLLPVLLIARARLVARLGWVPLRRWREAGILLIALLGVGGLVLLDSNASGAGLYAPLPLLLWAAVRFGPGGTSAAVLTVAILAITGTLGERGPFVTQSPEDGLLQLQLFLFVVSVPLLLLSALLQEQRRTADELRASQRQYRTIVEDQTELICRFRPDGALTFVNGAFGRAMGRAPEELLGSFFWSFVPPEPRDTQSGLLAGLTPTSSLLTWEQRLLGGPAGNRWEQWRVRALFDDAGRVVDYQAVGRDITERKRAEEEHALLESQRAHAAALREADRRKDEFLAMLAHELRNPLAPIAMAVEILRHVRSNDEHIDSARDIIGRQTAQLARLVDDLLDVARITSGSIQLRMEMVDLARIISSTLEISRPLIVARRLKVDTHLPTGQLIVRGDPVRLAQLFSNLVNNGAKYSEIGGRITITVVREAKDVLLRFEDTGAGIPRDMLERIFEPFTQVQRPRDAALGGLGLGLALVKMLVELHGGTVRAESGGPGTGSEFLVRLPATEAVAEARAVGDRPGPDPADLTPALGATPLRILVVDDVEDAAESLADFLRLQGDTVHVARDGRTALELAAQLGPEVVFVDLQMPEIDGLEVARRLRGRGELPRTLLVAVTGLGQAENRRQTAEAGFDHHLTKPLDPSQVQALLAMRRGKDRRSGIA